MAGGRPRVAAGNATGPLSAGPCRAAGRRGL